MITTKRLEQYMELCSKKQGYTIEGSTECGKVVIAYERPNGLEIGSGLPDSKVSWRKQARMWKGFKVN